MPVEYVTPVFIVHDDLCRIEGLGDFALFEIIVCHA
jgi:hypothetical protein